MGSKYLKSETIISNNIKALRYFGTVVCYIDTKGVKGNFHRTMPGYISADCLNIVNAFLSKEYGVKLGRPSWNSMKCEQIPIEM